MSETPRIPDIAPALTMDSSLGQRLKPGEVINFNYDQYAQMAKDMGATDEQIEGVHVDIIDPSERPGVGGMYHKATTELPPITEIVYGARNPLGRKTDLNKFLAHETQHYLDDQNGELPDELPESYKEGIKQTMTGVKLIKLGALGTAGAVVLFPPAAVIAIPTLTTGIMKTAFSANYNNNPLEQKAREAEKQFGDRQIITTDKLEI